VNLFRRFWTETDSTKPSHAEIVMNASTRVIFGWLVVCLSLAGAEGSAGLAWAQTAPPQELTLADAVKTALEKHPALRIAEYQAAAAASGVDQARAGFFPRVDFSEGFSRSDNPVYAFGSLLNQGRFTAADFAVNTLNHPDPITNWRTNLGGSVPLFLGGRNVLGYQQAQLGRHILWVKRWPHLPAQTRSHHLRVDQRLEQIRQGGVYPFWLDQNRQGCERRGGKGGGRRLSGQRHGGCGRQGLGGCGRRLRELAGREADHQTEARDVWILQGFLQEFW
jgi:hypothetical protein